MESMKQAIIAKLFSFTFMPTKSWLLVIAYNAIFDQIKKN